MIVVCKRCGGLPCVCAFLEEAGVLPRSRARHTETYLEKLERRIKRLEEIIERKGLS